MLPRDVECANWWFHLHRIDEPSYIYSHVEPGGPLVEWQSQIVLADATDTTKKHELRKHQEHSIRINFKVRITQIYSMTREIKKKQQQQLRADWVTITT
jgi:hypothetical protein